MICPRCGVSNPAQRTSCSRCSGSLTPPPARDERPMPDVLPVTKRAELAMGHARLAAASPGSGPGAGEPGRYAPAPADLEQSAELYLLSADRPTGQPLPPEGPLGHPGPVRSADRPGRLTVGLSGA
ncbi:MAG TPA: zinc finger Ran-binding domain-containing protein [Acidimicrobiales bacterium]|nr:zinc finger Ran-binding domain-containing protein [Acidimicrobiales bacterium]